MTTWHVTRVTRRGERREQGCEQDLAANERGFMTALMLNVLAQGQSDQSPFLKSEWDPAYTCKCGVARV